jgi:hypothetical protein
MERKNQTPEASTFTIGAAGAMPQMARIPGPEVSADIQSPVNSPTVPVPAAAPFPYVRIVVSSLTAALCAAVVVFIVADDVARTEWNSIATIIIAAAICVFAVRTSMQTANAQSVHSEVFALNRTKLLRRAWFFTLAFCAIAGIVGYEIGTSGIETSKLFADLKQMSSIGDRISQARNSAERTVGGQIVMYKSIDDDVRQFDVVVNRLTTEIALYDGKFPAQHEANAKTISSIATAVKRAKLLRQEIELAKSIEALDPQSQWNIWQSGMQPLLTQEDSLDSK